MPNVVVKRRRGASPRGIVPRPPRVYPARTEVKSLTPRLWAMRKRGWVEFRVSPTRPRRRFSSVTVGDIRLSGWWMEGGEFLGMAEASGYIRFKDGSRLRVPTLPNGGMVEVEWVSVEKLKGVFDD